MVGLDRSGLKHSKTGEPKSPSEMEFISVNMSITVIKELEHSLPSLISSDVHTLPFPIPAESETLGENHPPTQGSTDIIDRQEYRPFETYVPECIFKPRITLCIGTNVSQNAIACSCGPVAVRSPVPVKCPTSRSRGNRVLGQLAKTQYVAGPGRRRRRREINW